MIHTSTTPEAVSAHVAGQAPLIRVTSLTKTYFLDGISVPALKHVEFTVMPGEFVAIMGASGSGKSTLMNILGCLDRPTSGHYELAGEDVSKMDRDALANIRNRRIGFVFQGFNLLSRTSAIENVELPLLYAGANSSVRRERARAALAQVGLADREHHHPNQLSGGQQQRVAIARALVNSPPMILADEPTGNLDTRTSIEVMGILQELNHRGITIVLITHENDISQFAGRRIVLRDGLILKDEVVQRRLEAAAELAKLPPAVDATAPIEP